MTQWGGWDALKVTVPPACFCSELGWESSVLGEMGFDVTLPLCSLGAWSCVRLSRLARPAFRLVMCMSVKWVSLGVGKTKREGGVRPALTFGRVPHRSQNQRVCFSVCMPTSAETSTQVWVTSLLFLVSPSGFLCARMNVVLGELVFLEGVEAKSPWGKKMPPLFFSTIFPHPSFPDPPSMMLEVLFEISLPSLLLGQPSSPSEKR